MKNLIENFLRALNLQSLLETENAAVLFRVLLLLAIIIGLIILPIIIIKVRKIKTRKAFLEDYHINIPQKMEVKKRKDGNTDNRIKLKFPEWEYAKKDKTADLRVGDNDVIWHNSYIYVGKYVLVTDEVDLIPDVVRGLRNIGVELPPHPIELENYKRLVEKQEQKAKGTTLQGLVELFSTRPSKFEKYCAELLQNKGYKTTLTPPTNDGGYDIKAYKDGKSYIIECKCYAPGHTIGRPLLQKLYGANAVVQADKMMFMTTSEYTKAALQYAEEMGMILIDGIQLMKMSNTDKQEEIIQEDNWHMKVEDLKRYIPRDLYKEYF